MANRIAPALAALADPTRRAVFERIGKAPAAVGEIAAGLPVSRPAVSQHLKVLKEAGLIAAEKESRENYYTLVWDEPIGQLKTLIEQAEVACS